MYIPRIALRTILTSTFPAGKNSTQGRIPWETTIWRGTIWKMIFLTRICRQRGMALLHRTGKAWPGGHHGYGCAAERHRRGGTRFLEALPEVRQRRPCHVLRTPGAGIGLCLTAAGVAANAVPSPQGASIRRERSLSGAGIGGIP